MTAGAPQSATAYQDVTLQPGPVPDLVANDKLNPGREMRIRFRSEGREQVIELVHSTSINPTITVAWEEYLGA